MVLLVGSSANVVSGCIADSADQATRVDPDADEEAGEGFLHLARAGTVRPVIGQVIEFADVPAWPERPEGRETTGRIVVRPPSTAP